MDRFVRRDAPKPRADSTPQPVDSAAAAAPQRGTTPESVANPAADAAYEVESNAEASSVEGEYSHTTGLLYDLTKELPAAGQWAAKLPSDAEVRSSFDAYLRHRARQLLGYIATLKTQKTLRKDNILKIREYSRSHTVAETQAHLRKKAARQLRELHEAAQAHRPDADAYLQALNAAQNGSPHAAQLLLWGFNLLDPTRSQTAMWHLQQELLSGRPEPKKGRTKNNRAKAVREDVWQLWKRKAAQFLPDVACSSSAGPSSKTIREMFSSTASTASRTLAAPQREASLWQDQEGNDHTSHAAASSVAPRRGRIAPENAPEAPDSGASQPTDCATVNASLVHPKDLSSNPWSRAEPRAREPKIHSDDVGWLMHHSVMQARADLAKLFYEQQVFKQESNEIETMFENLKSISELKPMLANMTSLARSRAEAYGASSRIFQKLNSIDEEIQMRMQNLQKVAWRVFEDNLSGPAPKDTKRCKTLHAVPSDVS